METKLHSTDNTRIYLFDNIRALLIFLVVFGHMLTLELGQFNLMDTIYFYIFLFHIPAFIYISGYFSKNVEKCRSTAVKSFFIPYIVLNSIGWIFDRFIINDSQDPFRLLDPGWGLWFLLNMFIYKLLLKDLVKVRHVIVLCIITGLLSGLSTEFTSYMTLARLLSFLPFFLLGYYTKEEHIERIRKFPKLLCRLTLVFFFLISYMIVKFNLFNKEYLYLRRPYEEIQKGDLRGILIRAFIYIAAIIITICLINLMSIDKTRFSMIGQNSITVYVLHLFIVKFLRTLSLPWDGTIYYLIYGFIMSLLLTYGLSRPVILSFYKRGMERIVSFFMKE